MDLSLLEAIKQKYCPDEVGIDKNTLPTHKPVKETATIYRPGMLQFAVHEQRYDYQLILHRSQASAPVKLCGAG